MSHLDCSCISASDQAVDRGVIQQPTAWQCCSALLRAGWPLQVEGSASAGPEHWGLLKGAPEVVEGFLQEAPPDFSACYRQYASQGGR